MARHGDGIYLRGQTWYLDCRLNGARHVIKLGKVIARHAAKEIAQVKRAAILKGEVGTDASGKICPLTKRERNWRHGLTPARNPAPHEPTRNASVDWRNRSAAHA